MTATERIRAMLDERGVEYRTHGMTDRTWFDVDGISWFVIERENGGIAVEAVFLTPEQAIEATLGSDLEAENAKLREQTGLLIALLSNDCNIEASWDGLRKFWNIGLTEDGCLMRDRACKAEAENAKLRELVRDMYKAFVHGNCYRWCEFKEPCNYISDGRCQWYERAHELGVEV